MNKYVSFIIVLFLISCASGKKITDTREDAFVVSETPVSEVLNRMQVSPIPVHAIEGRARSQASGPDYSERATVQFLSNREQSMLIIRNQLGIEGGRILSDRDSVLIYDPIERKAWKMSINTADRVLLNGFSAFNILDFLIPEITEDSVEVVLENNGLWKILLNDGSELIVNQANGTLQSFYTPSDAPQTFNRFVFSNHATLSGIVLPRRIQILSNDYKSNIFMHIQDLTLNPVQPVFDLNIPSNISIERRD